MKSLRSCLLGTGTAALLLGCGGADANHDHPVAPPPTSSTIDMSVVSGANASDTIDAVLRQPLVVELRDGSGALVAGQAVLFESVPAKDSTGAPRYMAGFPAGTGQIATVAQSVTNGQGQAGVPVVLGEVAGPAQIAISVQGGDAKQVVTILVTPGAPTRFAFLPADTGVAIGGATRLRAGSVDRAGNVGTAGVVYAASPDPEVATVSPSGVVTGVAAGTVTLTASLGSATATGRVEVAPKGTIAAYYLAPVDSDPSGIVTLNLDGSGRHWVTTAYGSFDGPPSPIWGASGTIIYTAPSPGKTYGDGRLLVVTPGSAPALLNASGTPGAARESWPEYNAATGKVFYSGFTQGGPWQLYSRAGDGTITLISPEGPTASANYPSPSPDGSKVAYVASLNDSPVVRVYDLVTQTASTWSVPGSAPQWSPKGDRIAYLATPNSLISVVNADGTNAHILVPANAGAPFSWSPDGAWVIGKSLGPSGALNVVNATTGAKVALTYLSPYYYPSWK